jgi:hypothetical protein
VTISGTQVALDGTPKSITCLSYEGAHEIADCGAIAGWVRDARQPQVPINVDVYDGATQLTTVTADRTRQDLAAAGNDDGRHGFVYPVPTSLKDGKPHAIRVTISGTQVDLDGTPKSITCLGYEGVHETADCNAVVGWAWNTTQPNASIDVEIYDNDLLLGHVSADQFRQDLADGGKGNGAHAFAYTLPSGVKDGRPHTISVKTSEGDTHLVDTPKVIQCQK